MQICVFGMGKIGLPLAVQYALKGHEVRGVDIEENRVFEINQGVEPFPGEENLLSYLGKVLDSGLFRATTDAELAVRESQNMVVAVPLIVNQDAEPDFSALDAVTDVIGRNLKKNDLVIYETTLPIGTTRNRFLPELEKLSGLKCPEDFSLVFSPERVLTGRVFQDLRKYPKLVGGIAQSCAKRGVDFYKSALDFDLRSDLQQENGVWVLQSTEAAEFVKLAETTYRDVNIALANQFAIDASRANLDIESIISAANSQPYSRIHTPGISVGGHCIPVYPLLYLSTNPNSEIVRVARNFNAEMPKRAVSRLQQEFGQLSGKTIAVIGVSYRTGVKETAFSGAYALQSILKTLSARPVFYDPLYSNDELEQLGFEATKEIDTSVELVILHTHYKETLERISLLYPSCTGLFDGRGLVIPNELPAHIKLVRF
jgi:UDP-N-acetyl-D-glucosamine dehydrogenase